MCGEQWKTSCSFTSTAGIGRWDNWEQTIQLFQEGDRKHILSPAVHVTKHMAFASVGYCLASPERQLSKTVRDVVEAVKVSFFLNFWLNHQFLIDRYPQVKEITLGGHSAGAFLAFQGNRMNKEKIEFSCYPSSPSQNKETGFHGRNIPAGRARLLWDWANYWVSLRKDDEQSWSD